MEYWQQQIGTHDTLVANHSKINFTNSKIDAEILQDFYKFITPTKKQVLNSYPPVLKKHNRIKQGIITSAA